MRVSVDHYTIEKHEQERGPGSWQPMIDGLCWLSEHGFRIHVAGRTFWNEDEPSMRRGFGDLLSSLAIDVDANDSRALVLFPELSPDADVPEITTD